MDPDASESVEVQVALLGGRSCSVRARPTDTLDELQASIAEALDMVDAGELRFVNGEAQMLAGTETAVAAAAMGVLQAMVCSPYPLEVEGFKAGIYDPLQKRFQGKPVYKWRDGDAFFYYSEGWKHSPDYCSNAWQMEQTRSNVFSPDLCAGPWTHGNVIRQSDALPLPEQPLLEMVSCEVSLQCKLQPWFAKHGNLLPTGRGSSQLDSCPAIYCEMRFSDGTTASNRYIAAKYGFELDFSGDPDGLLRRPSGPDAPYGQLIASGKGIGKVRFGIRFKDAPEMKHAVDVHVVAGDFDMDAS